jgi:MSHA pilin protein MshD
MASQRGFSLVEVIMFIVIISLAMTGVLLVMNSVTRHSVDPMIHKQALAVAESLLEEVELQDFIPASGVTPTAPVTQLNRASGYHIVSGYNGFTTTGVYPVSSSSPIAGLAGYTPTVAVTPVAFGGITLASASAVLITVTVDSGSCDPHPCVVLDGYRTAR